MLCKNALTAIDHTINSTRNTNIYPSLHWLHKSYWAKYSNIVKYFNLLQGKTKAGALQFDLVTNRDGAKYYIKPRPSPKDMSWKDSIASATLQVNIIGNI